MVSYPRISSPGQSIRQDMGLIPCSRLPGYAASDERCAGVGEINVLNDFFISFSYLFSFLSKLEFQT